jgi:hypothetical protein
MRRLAAPGDLDLSRRARAGAPPRVRRDPRVLIELLLSPLAAARPRGA